MSTSSARRAKYFSLLNILGREKDAGARLCPRRRRGAPGTRRGPRGRDGAGGRARGCARISGGEARSVRALRRKCSGWGGAGARSSWRSAPPPWSWWTSAARPPPEAACHTHQDTQVGRVTQTFMTRDTCVTPRHYYLWNRGYPHSILTLTRVHFVDDSNELQPGHCTRGLGPVLTDAHFYIDTFPCRAV